jgi:hypothetical protein
MLLAGALTQNITYWPTPNMDGYGQRQFSTPVLLRGRWEDRSDLKVQGPTEMVDVKSVAYLQQAVDIGGYLALGDYTETADTPEDLNNAYQVKAYKEIPAISGIDRLRKAFM